jgi:transcriptional regulator with XRE-family HTH domain
MRISQHGEKQLTIDPPLRSRLYSLVPLGMGTPLVESLSCYINRLAWTYRISPRVLLAQEIVSHLSGSYHFGSSYHLLAAFCRSWAMSINGAGATAADWSDTLERLTMRADLRGLTSYQWAAGLPPQGLLHKTPAWCPVCYSNWREEKRSIYQPLLWMLQVMTICPVHHRQLEEQCPHCEEKQSVIPTKEHQGYCTQCMNWLGTATDGVADDRIDEETLDWQLWVLHVIKELYLASTQTGVLPWERSSDGLAICVEAIGNVLQLAKQVNISDSLLSEWLKGKGIPSFKRLLERCYVLDVSLLQLITADPTTLNTVIQARSTHRSSRPRRPAPQPVNRERALQFIHAVLDGRESPLGIEQIEHHLGISDGNLAYLFPQECALVRTQYHAYRSERVRQRRI